MSKHLALLAAIAVAWQASYLRAEEKPGADGPDAGALFAQLDANKDGQLTGDEIPVDKKGLFERLLRTGDKNNDGKLNAEEFAAALKPRQRPDSTGAPAGNDGDAKPPKPEKMFRRLDANRDGKITLDEVPEAQREMFKQLLARGDKNGDGALDEPEFLRAIAGPFAAPPGGAPSDRPESRRPAQRLFMRLDKNGDGKVTLDEVPAERRPMIEELLRRFDKDGDKALSLEEFSAGFHQVRPDDSANRPGPPGGDQGRPLAGLFRALDTDRDGKLSSAEISAAAEVIRKLDKNGDGEVTPDEILAATRDSGDQSSPK